MIRLINKQTDQYKQKAIRLVTDINFLKMQQRILLNEAITNRINRMNGPEKGLMQLANAFETAEFIVASGIELRYELLKIKNIGK